MMMSTTNNLRTFYTGIVNKSSHVPKLQYLERGEGLKLAYRQSKPVSSASDITDHAKPGIIFCSGFQSNMEGIKALSLEQYCIQKDLAYLRFDYQGCGKSTGDLRKALFSDWKSDTVAVLDQLTTGPQIFVGSSMGAWLMILATMERPHRIHSLVGVSSAPDFTQRAFNRFSPEVLQVLKDSDGTIIDSEYGNYIITKNFLKDTQQYNLLHLKNIPILCPVRLIHGMNDDYVSPEISTQLAKKIASNDINVVIRKNGDHRLSTVDDIKILFEQLDDLIDRPSKSYEFADKTLQSFAEKFRSKEILEATKGE